MKLALLLHKQGLVATGVGTTVLPYNETENINIKSRKDITVESIDFGSKLKLILHKVTSTNQKILKRKLIFKIFQSGY